MLAKEPILILVTIYVREVSAGRSDRAEAVDRLCAPLRDIQCLCAYLFTKSLADYKPLIWEEGEGLRDFNSGETGLVFSERACLAPS